MSSTFKFHSTVGEVVPWNASYSFPTQSTQIQKSVVKIPCKNGDRFTQAGQIIRFELPAEGYLNVQNSVLQFDLERDGADGNFQLQRGGAHNVIKRLRVMYGSLVLEDIQEYKTLVRLFTEVGIQQDYLNSFGSLTEGMYAAKVPEQAPTKDPIEVPPSPGVLPTFASTGIAGTSTTALLSAGSMGSIVMRGKRRFCLSLLSGLLTTKKLIPLKWMASQLAIEITLADRLDAFVGASIAYPVGRVPTAPATNYIVSDPNFIAEIVEFDSSYDKAFFMGLQQGIPIKFSSWHTHRFAMTGAQQTFQIHERSRSVKAAFAVVKSSNAPNYYIDSDVFFHALGQTFNSDFGNYNETTLQTSPINEFQWRIGGRYYPSQPVDCRFGGAEAAVELLKTVNYLGNHTVAGGIDQINYTSWAASFNDAKDFGTGTKFIMACEFENTDVMPDTIAGINAEEQSDIALTIRAGGAPLNKELFAFIHFDALLIVKTGNTVELVM